MRVTMTIRDQAGFERACEGLARLTLELNQRFADSESNDSTSGTNEQEVPS
jgi:hypothetical protein